MMTKIGGKAHGVSLTQADHDRQNFKLRVPMNQPIINTWKKTGDFIINSHHFKVR